ncbi:DUF3466 family protein [Thalassotalea aquiviva]|uniref:DUF3466 family protein n=1 Tax=Thalassotalea aquiviva TaxID=3242415 RepID=UPI00352A0878
MKTLIKSLLTVSISSALLSHAANAATYEVIDLGLVDTVKNTYGIEQNNVNQSLLSGQTSYNFPVQFQYLDEDDFDAIVNLADQSHEQVFDLNDIEDEDALRAGNPTANDLAWTIRFLRARSGDTYQHYGDTFVFVNDGQETKQLTVFDQEIPGTGELSRSTNNVPAGITDDGWVYGTSSAPYLPLPVFTDNRDEEVVHWVTHSSDGDPLNGFSSRGWVSFDGESIVELVPFEATYGGVSAVNDININRVAVGTSSVDLNENTLEDINNDDNLGCFDNDWVGERVPFEVCIYRYKQNLYFSNAIKWEVNTDGSVNVVDLGTGVVNVNADDERSFTSSATAINDNDIIVGYSNFWWDKDETTPSKNERVGTFAAVFKNGQVLDFTDRDDYFESRATGINNSNVFIGHMWKSINGNARSKFFYADANSEQIVPVFPEDFFNGSSSLAHDINEHGVIVGEGEVETFIDSPSTPRRRHGFMYDINTDTFTDINSLLSCTSPYTVVEGRDINEKNEIIGTAFIKQDKLDAKGQPIIIDGAVQQEDVLRAVYLRPIEGGEVEDCSALEEKVERKGASFGLWSLFSLGLLGLSRRFFTK